MNDVIPEAFRAFLESIESIKELTDDKLTDEVTAETMAALKAGFSDAVVHAAVKQIISNLDDQGATREEMQTAIDTIKEVLNDEVYGDGLIAGNKRKLIDCVMESLYGIFDQVAEQYHSYAIELPIKLNEGAFIPTYAHSSDAAADLYALKDTVLPAHSFGNKIATGVSISLPEGWMAMILPRSSIGAKTPLRLSNSTGIIDSKQGAIQWAA